MRGRRWVRLGAAAAGVLLLAAAAAYLAARPTVIEGGAAPLTWAECHPEQVRVMVLGTFHFEPWSDELAGRPLDEILVALNRDLPPANAEMYRRFLPLVKEDVYAGALKLRPWYDRNLRTVQNLFRILEPEDRSVLLVIGSGHLRVLKQILEMTPQLCPVDPVPYLS